MLRALIQTALLVIALSAAAEAQWTPDGATVCGGGCFPGESLTVPDGSGGAYTAWRDERGFFSGTNSDVYLQRILADGTIAPGWPTSGLPACVQPQDQVPRDVVPDGLGGVIVVWTDARSVTPDTVGSELDIFALRVNPDGTLASGWSANGSPVTRAAIRQDFPAAAPDGQGGVFVAWTDDRDVLSTGRDIYAQHLGPDGQVVSGWPVDGMAIDVGPGPQSAPHILPDDTGGAVITWTGSPGTIRGIRLNADGSVATGWSSGGVPIVTGQVNERIARDEAGGFYVATATLVGTSESEYYARRFRFDGTLASGWPSGGLLVCSAPGTRGGLQVSADGTGGLLMAWQDNRAGSDLFAARVLSDATIAPGWIPNGTQVSVSPTMFDLNHRITHDGFGGLYITWEKDVAPRRLQVQHLTGNGAVAPGWPLGGREPSIIQHSQSNPSLATDGAGGAIVAWRNPTINEMQAQRFQMDGPVPVALSLASVEAEPTRVTLTWQGPGAGGLAAYAERRRSDDAPWQRLGDATSDGADRLRYEDRSVVAGERYVYRLTYVENGIERVSPETHVEVPRTLSLALEGFRPNPSAGLPAIAFTLPSATPARVEVLDVRGRRVFAREVGTLGVGRHVVRMDGGERLAPGVYMIRLSGQGHLLHARGAIIR